MGQLHFELIEKQQLTRFFVGELGLNRGKDWRISGHFTLTWEQNPGSAGSSSPIIAANVHHELDVDHSGRYDHCFVPSQQQPALKEQLLYHPYRVKAFKEWHRIVTHAFVRRLYAFGFECLRLFQFGARLEGLMQQTLGLRLSNALLWRNCLLRFPEWFGTMTIEITEALVPAAL